MSEAYPFVFAAGVLTSFLWLALSGPAARHIARIDAGLFALVGGLIGARVGFVCTHLEYYASRPTEALWFWQGGLSWVGGAAGAGIGLAALAILRSEEFWTLADDLSVPAAIMALASWTGCLQDGCAFGRRTQLSLLTPPTKDMFGWIAPRWPTQAVGALSSLATLILAYRLAGRQTTPGVSACLSLSLIATSALSLSFARGDPSGLLAGIRLDTLGAAAILLSSLALLGVRASSRRMTRDSHATSHPGSGAD